MTDEPEPEWDDRPDDPRDVIDAGKRRVVGPAAGLIAVVILLVGIVFLLAVQSGLMTAQFAQQQKMQEQQIDANPGLNAAQKAQMKKVMGRMYQGMGYFMMALAVTNLIAAGVLGHGAYRVLTLTGRGWGIAAAVVAMVPCFMGYSWVVGLPVGIWALVVLCQPDVKAAFAAARRERKLALGADPD